jgi:hypothetical protein
MESAGSDTLSVHEAALGYGVSVATLRRKLKEGEIPGAFKAPGPKGDEWRLPVSELLALGYRAVDDDQTEARDEHILAEMRELLHTLNRLMSTLETERQELMSVAEGHRIAEVEAARLKTELVGETVRRRRAEAELDVLKASQQRQQETIDELALTQTASGSFWGWLFWSLVLASIASIAGLIGFLIGG